MVAMTDNVKGAALMMASMACFVTNDAAMKALSDELPLAQAVALRSLATCALMVILMQAMGMAKHTLSRRDSRLIWVRNAMEVGTAYFFITALFNMPLANATAIMLVLPLTVTLAGAVFLGQPVGWRRLVAIGVGLVGVLLIVRPGVEGFNIYSLYVLIAVVMVTARDILSRKLSRDVPTLLVAFRNAISVFVAFAVMSLFVDWQPVSPKAAMQLGLASLVIIGGYSCAVAAMRVGEVAAIAPFRYSSLIWSLLLGLVYFGEWPDGVTLIGACIVVVTGVYTFWRERQIAQNSTAMK